MNLPTYLPTENITFPFQKFLLKTFYYNNKTTRKVKYFQNLFNKEIFFILQSNSTTYSKPFQLILWLNFLEGTQYSVLKSRVILLLIGLRNALKDIYFLTLQYIEWAIHQIFCVPDVKNPFTLSVILSVYCY